MKNVKGMALATAAGMALVASLGLAACSGTQATQGSADAAGTQGSATAQDAGATEGSTAAIYGFTKAWVGMGDDTMTYYYENADQTAGAVLVYYTADNAYERWVGPMEVSADGQRVITDDETGEMVSFTIEAVEADDASEGADDLIEFGFGEGSVVPMSPSPLDEVGDVLDTIGAYATKVGEEPVVPTAADLGGEFLIQINTEGIGHVAFTQDGESLGWGDSAFTHADAGVVLTLSAQPREEGWKFVKWTLDGADVSTEAEIEVTVEGDVEYVAVFEAE